MRTTMIVAKHDSGVACTFKIVPTNAENKDTPYISQSYVPQIMYVFQDTLDNGRKQDPYNDILICCLNNDTHSEIRTTKTEEKIPSSGTYPYSPYHNEKQKHSLQQHKLRDTPNNGQNDVLMIGTSKYCPNNDSDSKIPQQLQKHKVHRMARPRPDNAV